MYRTAIAILVTGVLLASPASALAQSGSHLGRSYDPATEVTVTDTVDEVKNTTAAGRGRGRVHLLARTDAGVVEVALDRRDSLAASASRSPRATTSLSRVRR
jgi:hypothetical protein